MIQESNLSKKESSGKSAFLPVLPPPFLHYMYFTLYVYYVYPNIYIIYVYIHM